MTDVSWPSLINTFINTVGMVLMAYIAFRQAQLKTQVKDIDTKADERSGKLDEVVTKVDEIHNSIPANFKP